MKTIKIMNYILPVVLLVLAATPIAAQEMNNSLLAYSRMGVGARVIAMGEAGSTVTNDIVSGYWNPAGLTRMKDFELGTMVNLDMGYNRSHNYASFGNRFRFGALALSWVNANVLDIDGYDENENPTGTFSDSENNFTLSYANSIGDFSFGFGPKFYLSTLEGESIYGYGVDFGAKYDINQYLEIGAMARDLYGEFDGATMPYQISAGLAAYPLKGLTLAADAKMEKDEDPYFCFGAEYWTSIGRDPEADSKLSVVSVSEQSSWEETLSTLQTGLRLGYNRGRLSAGTGIKLRNFQLDYVFRYNNHEVFGNDHILSLILRF
ncbi:MAG TPA: hypothetical protein P5031_01280 [Candidatus Syntrophosphaera sp.]|nr:hypothetical protein [Candidatus Cloacimonadota bacterium]HRQ67178.1 hypothetical protein [Candidatus Syntrophosphaera sp.]